MRHITLATMLMLSLSACSFSTSDDEDSAASGSRDSSQISAVDQDLYLNDSMSFSSTANSQISANETSGMDAQDDFDAPEYMQLQVVLDAMGFSPGIIDGKMGMSTENAISAFQQMSGIEETGTLDDATKTALESRMSTPATRVVTIPSEYGDLTFTDIPEDAKEKAEMERLGYENMWEKLAERFHTTKEVLQTLNPDLDMSAKPANGNNTKTARASKPDAKTAAKDDEEATTSGNSKRTLAVGSKLRVPNIGADKITKGSVDDSDWLATLISLGVGSEQPQAAKIVVDKSEATLKAFDKSGKLIAAYTATMGSSHDPLPLGNWDIVGKAYNPPFSLDPELMWDMPDDKEKLSLPPGPNGPVGVVWIDLSKEHYGIHGTPAPETIGRAQSHGCVRLTNWDAARLAQMVGTDTKVVFQA